MAADMGTAERIARTFYGASATIVFSLPDVTRTVAYAFAVVAVALLATCARPMRALPRADQAPDAPVVEDLTA